MNPTVASLEAQLAELDALLARIKTGLQAEPDSLRLYTVAQAAERLQVSPGTVRRLVSEYVELGEATRRISAATLRKLIESRTIKTP